MSNNGKRRWNFIRWMMGGFILLYLGIFVIKNSISIAPPGTTAAKVTFGSVAPEAYQGLFWRVPFCSYAVLVDTKQEMVREATKYVLTDLLAADEYIKIRDVLFYDPKFSQQFEQAIEQKMAAGQMLEIAKIQTLKVEEEAKQMIARAKAESEALKLKNQALTNPLIVKYEMVKMLQNWDGRLPSTVVSTGQESVLPIMPFSNNVKP